ncbi:MAG: hypothetical protein ACR2RA_04980 [Geminicoccaceae bacterium]
MSEFAQTKDIQWRGNVGTVVHGADAEAMVQFYKDPATGEDFIHLRFPGDKTFEPRRAVKETDKQRWPQQWDAYSRGTDQLEGQTRLEDLAWVDEATRRQFQALGIFSLEHLSAVTDGNLGNLGHGGRFFRDRAQQELAEKMKAGQADAAQAEARALRAELAELREEIRQGQRAPKVKERKRPKAKTKVPNAGVAFAGGIEDMTVPQLQGELKRRTGKGMKPGTSRDVLLSKLRELEN